MKKLLLCMSLMSYCMCVYSQRDLNGMYCSEDKRRTDCIVVFGNRFVYMEHGYCDVPFCCRDIFGNATYSWFNGEFIELHDSSLRNIADKTLKIRQRTVNSEEEGLFVRVSMPGLKDKSVVVRINYIMEDNPEDWLELEDVCSWKILNPKIGNVKPFMLPKGVKKIRIVVEPTYVPITRSNVETYMFYGSLYYMLPEICVKKCVNNIDVWLPAVTNESFVLYYLNGEYVRVQSDKLIWRGVAFDKSNASDDVLFIDELSREYNKHMDDNSLLDLIDAARSKVYGAKNNITF